MIIDRLKFGTADPSSIRKSSIVGCIYKVKLLNLVSISGAGIAGLLSIKFYVQGM